MDHPLRSIIASTLAILAVLLILAACFLDLAWARLAPAFGEIQPYPQLLMLIREPNSRTRVTLLNGLVAENLSARSGLATTIAAPQVLFRSRPRLRGIGVPRIELYEATAYGPSMTTIMTAPRSTASVSRDIPDELPPEPPRAEPTLYPVSYEMNVQTVHVRRGSLTVMAGDAPLPYLQMSGVEGTFDHLRLSPFAPDVLRGLFAVSKGHATATSATIGPYRVRNLDGVMRLDHGFLSLTWVAFTCGETRFEQIFKSLEVNLNGSVPELRLFPYLTGMPSDPKQILSPCREPR